MGTEGVTARNGAFWGGGSEVKSHVDVSGGGNGSGVVPGKTGLCRWLRVEYKA